MNKLEALVAEVKDLNEVEVRKNGAENVLAETVVNEEEGRTVFQIAFSAKPNFKATADFGFINEKTGRYNKGEYNLRHIRVSEVSEFNRVQGFAIDYAAFSEKKKSEKWVAKEPSEIIAEMPSTALPEGKLHYLDVMNFLFENGYRHYDCLKFFKKAE